MRGPGGGRSWPPPLWWTPPTPMSPRRWAVARRSPTCWRAAAGWVERVETIPWTITRLRVTGTIESSLYDALDKAMADSFLPGPERRQLAWAIADVYDWEVDFSRDLRPGDRFTVLLDRLESPEGERRFGRILAARVDVARTPQYAFYFEEAAGGEGGDAVTGFYDERGRSLRRAFLRAPLQFRRVTSRFGARYHPVLHRWRAHEGVDFAAAYGTPVRATADGIVARVGREDGGYGNLIEVRHPNGIRTRYGHLSGFARGLRRRVPDLSGLEGHWLPSQSWSSTPPLTSRAGASRVPPLKTRSPWRASSRATGPAGCTSWISIARSGRATTASWRGASSRAWGTGSASRWAERSGPRRQSPKCWPGGRAGW